MADENENDNPKVEYTKSTAQLDAERRAETQATEDPEVQVVEHFTAVQPTYGVEEDGAYLGTDPIYRNAADDRQEAMSSDDDWQRQLVTADLSDAGEKTLPFVPEQLGTGAPKVVESGPVTSTSTVAPADTTSTTVKTSSTQSTGNAPAAPVAPKSRNK